MEFLAVVDPESLEPRAVLSRLPDGGVEKASGSVDHPVEDWVEESFSEGASFNGGDSVEAGLLAFESDELHTASEALAAVTEEWESKSERLGRRAAHVAAFVSHPLGATVTQARVTFRERCVPRLLAAAGLPSEPFKPTLPTDIDESGKQILISAITPMFHDHDTLTVVVAPFETLTDAGFGLAYGLAYGGDRELVVLLARQHVKPTLRRAAFLEVPLRVFSYEARTVLGRWAFDVREEVLPAHEEVLQGYRDALVVAVHELGDDREPWVKELIAWANEHPHLQAVHRSSYLSWHCLGRQVLKLRRATKGVEITAGVDASVPSANFAPVYKPTVDHALDPAERGRITEAVDTAVERRLDGTDGGHVEHLLQALLAQDISALGLLTAGPGTARREFPAKRADGSRGYLDFLGADKYGCLHIVETKIGNDAMLVLQGLDYWIWAKAHRKSLAKLFGISGTPEIVVDFVVAATEDKPAVGPYTAAQAEALPGALRWCCHLVTGLADKDLKVARLGRLAWPEGTKSFGPKRYVSELLDHLAEPQHLPGAVVGGVLLASTDVGVVPSARWALEDLRSRGLLHPYVHHIRSSQSFALNLFGPLDRGDVLALLRMWFPDAIEADPPAFEWSDPEDRLHEATTQRPHRTQVDVLLRGRRRDGQTVAALVEVKLGETDFGSCSAYQAAKNDTRDACRLQGPFGSDPRRCFQLRNHDGDHRRRYNEFLASAGQTTLPGAGCTFRGSLNQPMRNVALLNSQLEAGDLADGVYALCAPEGNHNVHRTFARAQRLFGSRLHMLDPAEVLARHRHPQAAALGARYQIPYDPHGDLSIQSQVAELPQLLREQLSWQVAALLVRRHPCELLVIETHPGGGQYDCLAIYLRRDPHDGPHIDLNRVGRMHAFDSDGTWTPLETTWWDLAVGRITIDEVAAELERLSGLPTPDADLRSPNDPADIIIHAIAQVAASLDPTENWTWRNGRLDTSGHSSGGHHDEWFDQFPSAAAALHRPLVGDLLGQAAYRFWFLLRGEQPIVCLEAVGALHQPDGTSSGLVSAETATSVISEVLLSAEQDSE